MSAARNFSFKLHGLLTLLYRHRAPSYDGTVTQLKYFRSNVFLSRYEHGNHMNHGLRFICAKSGEADGKTHGFDMVKDEDKKVSKQGPPSQKSGFSTWATMIWSSVLAISLSYFQKWRKLLALEGEVEKVVEEVEEASEVVEKVATVTGKVAAEVAEQLPDKTLIKAAALAVEHISNAVASDVQSTEDFVHKIEEVKQDLKDLEIMAEPLVDEIKHPKVDSDQN